MKAAIYQGKGEIKTGEVPTPDLGQDDILLKVNACGVCGTDIIKVVHDLVPPHTVLGHEISGVVAKVGQTVTKFKVGDRVVVAHHTPCYVCHYCRHGNVSMCKLFKSSNLDPGGFSQYVRIPAMHVQMTAFKIPDHVTDDEAIFMEPLACIVRNIKRAQLLRGDTVWIVGLGSVGLLTGQVAKANGCHVIATDLKNYRLALGKALGFDACIMADDQNALIESIHRTTQNRGVDLAVLTAGNADVYTRSLDFVRDGGKISIFAGLAPGSKLNMDINEIYKREITIFSSYSPSPAELAESLSLISNRTVDTSVLSASSYDLDSVSHAINAAAEQKVFKAIIHP